jgi:hypothetical protein
VSNKQPTRIYFGFFYGATQPICDRRIYPILKPDEMKKIVLLLLVAFVLNSCDAGDDSQPQVHYELLPISRCNMPYSFTSGQTYEFTMIYKMPTTCHSYKGIYFEGEGTTKTVAIQSVVYERSDCQVIDYSSNAQPAPEPEISNYEFKATAPVGSVYTFKIWTGKDEQGEDTYYDVTIPVQD